MLDWGLNVQVTLNTTVFSSGGALDQIGQSRVHAIAAVQQVWVLGQADTTGSALANEAYT